MSKMETMKATPGPWRTGGGSYIPICADVNGVSAQIGRAESFGQISDEEVEANGRLMGAAWELLEALEQALDRMEMVEGFPACGAAITYARTAIAKATGAPLEPVSE